MTTCVFHMTNKAREDYPMSWLNAENIKVNTASHNFVAEVNSEDLNEVFRLGLFKRGVAL